MRRPSALWETLFGAYQSPNVLAGQLVLPSQLLSALPLNLHLRKSCLVLGSAEIRIRLFGQAESLHYGAQRVVVKASISSYRIPILPST